MCRGQIEVPVRLALKNMTLKSRSSAEWSSQKPNSSAMRFPFRTRSPWGFSHRMLRLSHPENGTGSLISKMGNPCLEKHAYSVHAWTWCEVYFMKARTHAMVSFPSLLLSVHEMISLSSLRESSFWLNASSSGSSILQWRHSSSRLPSGQSQSHARAPFLPFALSLARALSMVCWVRARQSVAYRLQSSIVT